MASSTPGNEEREARFAALAGQLGYLNAAELERVRQAYWFADAAHEGQTRQSGEPYITHPVAVAAQVAAWKLDAPALQAALLHDVMEDCGVQRADVAASFGTQVADMVDGLTKLDKMQFSSRAEGQAESFRKMLLAMARDVRVILIKLADRLHNMRTLGAAPPHKWGRISGETLDIYAPIAERLGLHQAQRELQELALAHLRPWRYSVLQRAVQRARARPRAASHQICQKVQQALEAAHLAARASERARSLPTLYRLMREQRLTFASLSDQCPLRIIASTPLECYAALGVLHQIYKPLPGHFKDYIAIPKSNGYQSLHTELAGPPGITLHVQIRTEAMDLVAENGVAAHWMHRASRRTAPQEEGAAAEEAPWLQSMLEIQHETSDAFEFWENIRAGLTEDAVYVFTPRGRVLALPQGATPIDFAYAIHTGIGDRAVGARINGEPVPLNRPLAGGDVVDIVTAAGSRPQPEWLEFVRTGRARSHIRSQLKERAQTEIRALGERLLDQALRAEGLPDVSAEQRATVRDEVLRFAGKRTREELLEDIGAGRTSASVLARHAAVLLLGAGITRADPLTLTRERFAQQDGLAHDAVSLDGAPDVRIHYARCCRPIPGDAVLGYLAQGEGLAVHAESCPVVQDLQRKDPGRFVPVAWGEPVRPFAADIVVTVSNAVGVLARVTAALAGDGVDISRIHMDDDVSQQNVLEIAFTIAVQDLTHLHDILHHLRRTPSVQHAERSAPKERAAPGAA